LHFFSVAISSQAVAGNSTWPFVSVEDWSLKAEKLVDLAGIGKSPRLVFAPIVEEDDRANWANYITESAPSWYQNSIDNEELNTTAEEFVNKTIPFVHFYDLENNFQPTPVIRPGQAVPIWQAYPLATGIFDPTIDLTLTNFDLLNGPNAASLFGATSAALSPSIGTTSLETDPETQQQVTVSAVMQPIFKGLSTKSEDQKLAAVVLLRLNWMLYLQNILVEGTDGIVAVLRSTCPNVDVFSHNWTVDERYPPEEVGTFSYQINGPRAVFLGEFDAHVPQYDALEISDVFVDLDVDPTKVPEGRCVPRMTLHLYPSKEFEQAFRTPNGMIYAGVVALIFVFTSAVFILYDYFITRRQRIVMERIVKQDKIVANIFPTAIRNRLYDQDQQSQGKLNRDSIFDPLGFDGPSNITGSAPLADLFPSTTVIFADIAGFTPWASTREPQQVFILLESIYGAFDKVAYRHGVFKVETVGDCYVAVTGLPEPTDDHAVAAIKFARGCLQKMKETTLKLEVSLGPDTADLGMRIGIHRYVWCDRWLKLHDCD
jgi:hypothetical protein